MSTRARKTKERLPPELEMTWPNFLLPVFLSSVLMCACWAVGHFQLSFLWIVLFTVLYVLKTHSWIRREQHRMSMRSMIMREREMVMAQYSRVDDLPAWVQFPDIERIEWVNKIIQQIWPHIGEYTKVFLKEFIEPQIRAQLPAPFKSFKFVAVDMGDIPFRVGGLKVYTQNVGRDRVIMDMDVVYAGDAEFAVQACGFRGGLNQMVFSGKLRCTLQPLLSQPPMVGGVSSSFMELPKFDFNLTGMGEFVQLPGLIDAIRSVVNTQVANLLVLPNKIVVPLAPNVDVAKLYFPEPDGIVRMKIIEAMNLENKDGSFLNKRDISDPYCEIQVGSQVFHTRVINNNLNPVFNVCFEAVVDQASGQKLRIELFDKDTAGADEELGRLSIPLESVRQAGEMERWHHLEGCKHGELRLKVCWMDLSTESMGVGRDEWEQEWLGADKPMHPALLMVFIDSVANLPYPKSNLEPSPFVEVSLGRITQRTPVKPKTVNPLFQSKFNFFVKQPEGQELKIRAVDEGTKRDIGELSIPLAAVMREPMMEMSQQSFYLTHGVHSSPIVLTARLRFFTPPRKVLEARDLSSTYGNAVHIERGDRTNSSLSEEDGQSNHNGNDMAKQQQQNVHNVKLENEVIQNRQLAAAATEPAKMVANGHNSSATMNNDDLSPDLDVHGNKLASSVGRTQSDSSKSSLRTANSSLLSSRAEGILGKLIGGKHTKKKKRKSLLSSAGRIQIGLKYDGDRFKLIVSVIAAKDLSPVEKEGHADPYVTLRLMPSANGHPATTKVQKGRKHTEVVPNSLDPQFNQNFEFDIHCSDFPNFKLHLAVKDGINYGLLHSTPTFGVAEVPLHNFDPLKPIVSQWLDLSSPQR
ncbi:hypothetical protein niasHS_014574 [Heterodera schachtii]|uniref:Uncharacterized protein n=1 Tax=Heterodera schachtii TaxID=97005 RepID=A0ABD2II56_HETSC